MGDFEFEGDTKDVSARQLEFISSVLTDRGYKNGKVTIEPVGKAGDNYIANVKRIVIIKDGETFKMIAKVAPGVEALRKMMNTAIMFRNEHIMYSEVLPKLAKLEEQANIPDSERLKFAGFYGSFMEEPNEIILLEDLNVTKFVILDRYKSLTSETVKLVLRSFAILHSLSYALKNQEPETFERFSEILFYMWDVMDQQEEMQLYLVQLENDVLSIIDNDEHKALVKDSITQMFVHAINIREHYIKTDYCVIQQGDSWTNNIMFRLDGEEAVECCMIDYQISNKNSPVADLHYMIFNCTDYETRSKHYHEWIDYYHNELDKRLSNFGLRAIDVYPREQLDDDLKRQGKLTFGLSIMLASMLQKENHEAASMKEAFQKETNMEEMLELSKLSAMESTSLVRFKSRVSGLLKSFIELGYL